MTSIRTTVLLSVVAIISALAIAAPPAGGKPKPKPRKCPADAVVIAGKPIAKILTMLGAKREAGATDKQLLAYVSHYNRCDVDKDGKVTRKEYVEKGKHMNPRARAGIFGATDNNADGIATRVEYVLNRIITDEAKGIVQKCDANKDGKITRAEFVAGSPIKDAKLAGAAEKRAEAADKLAGEVFDALDSNGDGVTTIPEYLRVWGAWARPNYKAQEAALTKRLAKLLKPAKSKPKKSAAAK